MTRQPSPRYDFYDESKLDRMAGHRERIAELRAMERRIAVESRMPGGRYQSAVADARPMVPYGGSPNLQPIRW